MELSTQSLQQALVTAELEARVTSGPPEVPFDQILVPIGADRYGHEMNLQIGLLNGPVPTDLDKERSFETLQLQFIQFLVVFPITIQAEYLQDTQYFINLLNSVTELPGFGILDNERIPFYRYTLLCHHNQIDENFFIMVVGLIFYVIDNYLKGIEEIASGERKLAELLAKAKETSK